VISPPCANGRYAGEAPMDNRENDKAAHDTRPDARPGIGPPSRGRSPREELEALGAVPLRAPMGDRSRGLQPRRIRLDVLPPRPRTLAGLSLGRGRPRRHLGPASVRLLLSRALERTRPNPQGAALRPDGARREPRRGRQGVLLLPRLHADPLVHAVPLQVPAGG